MRRLFDRSMKHQRLERVPRHRVAASLGADLEPAEADPLTDADLIPDDDGVPPAWRRQWRDGSDSPYPSGSVPDIAWRFGRELDRREQSVSETTLGRIGRDQIRDDQAARLDGRSGLARASQMPDASTTRVQTRLRGTLGPMSKLHQRPSGAKQPGLGASRVAPDKSSFGAATLFGRGLGRRVIAEKAQRDSERIKVFSPSSLRGALAVEGRGRNRSTGNAATRRDAESIQRISDKTDASVARVPLGAPEGFQKIGDKTYPDGWRTPRQAPESSYADAPRLINPVPGGRLRNDAAGKGWYLAPREDSHGHRYDHTGIDIAAAAGQNVVSPISGEVTKLGFVDGNLTYVQITAPDERYVVRVLYTTHGVEIGRNVEAGETIGQVQSASAGYRNPAMTDHVHLEVWDVKLPGIVDAVRPREKRWGHLEPTRLMDDFEL